MQQTDIIIVRQIIILILLGLTGFIAGKTKFLPKETSDILSKVIVKLTTPLLILTTMASYSFSGKTLINGSYIFLFGLFFLLISLVLSVFISRKLGLSGPTANIYRMSSTFGNVVFMAYPLLSALYGDQGIIYAIFFNLSNDLLLWTLGIYLVNRHNTTRWKDNLKHLVNGNTIAFVLGIFLTAINFHHLIEIHPVAGKVYRVLNDAFSPLGKTTIYISMIFIGLILSEIKIGGIKGLIDRYPHFLMSLLKLLIIPAASFVILSLIGGLPDPFIKKIVVLQLGMPTGTIIAALANQYDSDYKFATEGIFVSTVLSVITLPLLAYAVEFISLF
jgi:predicted permease